MLHRPRVVVPAVVLAALVWSSAAPADVVMAPPTNCPKGQIGTTSHGGPRCEKEPPKDCPNGWTGRVGGDCALTPCTSDDDCSSGQACVSHTVCLEPFADEYYDWNEPQPHEPETRAAPPRGPSLLGGPMPQRVKRPKPIYRYNAVNVCGGGPACASPRSCQAEKLCVPRGTTAQAFLGTNVGAARVARKTDTPLASKAEPEEPTTPTTTATPSGVPTPADGRGCGGCAEGNAGAGGWGWFAAAGSFVAVLVGARLAAGRRRRRG